MNTISTLLERFRHLVPQQHVVGDATVSVVYEMFGYQIARTDVHLQNNIIHITSAAALKHAIHLQKSDVLAKIRTQSGATYIKDIR